jgi:hypothetical protein
MKKLLFFLYLIFLSVNFFGQKQNSSQQEVDILYNAAVEKYIKNDYDKAVEYMEKVYSISPQQKYKNFIVKVLYEAANSNYMRQNYVKAYEYTTKALKYTTEDEKINQLHKILNDLITKEKKETKKFYDEKKQESKPQTETKQKETDKKETEKIQQQTKPKQQYQPTTEIKETQVIYIEKKTYKILFYVLLIVLFLMIAILIFLQMKFNLKLKNQLQQKVESLQKENEKLKTELIEAKKEVEFSKEKEKIYEQRIREYESEIKEKTNTIASLQNQINNLYKEKSSQQKTAVASRPLPTENFFDKQQTEILNFLSKLQQPQIKSDYELEIYKERISLMLKSLYELNPKKTYSILEKMLKDENPLMRMNVIPALIEIGNEETFSILFSLYYNDPDVKVRGEVLRYFVRLKNKIEQGEVDLPENIKEKIIDIVRQEKAKGEWLF